MTTEQRELVDAITRALAADHDIEGAWLAGSLGAGKGDVFSDVDVLVLAPAGKAGAVSSRVSRDIATIAEPALVNPLYGGRVLNVVTADWRRFDLHFVEPGDLGRFDAARLVLLFNKGEHVPPRVRTDPYQSTPETVLKLVNEFLRILGLLVVAIGREEYVLGLTGVDHLRRLTVDLMLEENGVGPIERGGALHRNPLLTPDQRREFEALKPVVADRPGIIAAHAELAAIFLTRARRLAMRTPMTWPSAFEEATRRHLQERLGLTID
jgi:predicted nucleotidyltransferase